MSATLGTMCGRYTLHSPADAFRDRFGVEFDELDLGPRYNIAPSQPVLTVSLGRDGARRGLMMRWGLIPPWSSTPSTKLSTINAKSETAAASKLYGRPFRKRRCLILADGFYEWQAPETSRGPKIPHWIARTDRAPFAFAGLYSVWRPRDESETPPLLSCTILTTAANAIVAPIHARMPVILSPSVEASWIDRALVDPDGITALLKPNADALVAQPVSRRVNSPRNDGPDLLLSPPEAGFEERTE